ncbi:MAG TPA: carboxylesterase family protein, partial [Sphingopyxis sp.]|nr:carboxylesterase family protein [Sphingopyxis sp.]
GVRPATDYGFSCPQKPFPGDSQPIETETSEDCLTLNVWTGAESGKPRPVMVWIHGGGLMNGGSATPSTDGRALARRGVVVVTFNYRLGRLGFFAHPALSAESPGAPLANYGYMDQIAALQWVKANIAAFGGDPGNVTIFGESAGGGSVAMLMTSPLARGLFDKAIIQSGGGRQVPIAMRGASADGGPSMEEIGESFARDAGIKDDVLAGLRALPADKVIGGVNMVNNFDRKKSVNWSVDGVLLTADPTTVFLRGDQAKVPLIVGANSDELGSIPMIGALAAYALSQFGEAAPLIKALYRRPDGDDDIKRLPGDAGFVEPARYMARRAAETGGKAWHYSFGYVASAKREKLKGAPHASEIPYVFGNPDVIEGATEADRQMAAAVSAAWVRFAKTGDPAGGGIVWPAYDPGSWPTLVWDAVPHTVANLDGARLDLIEQAYTQSIWSKLAQ